MLSSVSSGLPPTPLAPSGDAMAGGRDEPVGHGALQKGGMPQLTPPQICSLTILWLGNGQTEAEAAPCLPLAGESHRAPWHPTGTLQSQKGPAALCLPELPPGWSKQSQELDGYRGRRQGVWSVAVG